MLRSTALKQKCTSTNSQEAAGSLKSYSITVTWLNVSSYFSHWGKQWIGISNIFYFQSKKSPSDSTTSHTVLCSEEKWTPGANAKLAPVLYTIAVTNLQMSVMGRRVGCLTNSPPFIHPFYCAHCRVFGLTASLPIVLVQVSTMLDTKLSLLAETPPPQLPPPPLKKMKKEKEKHLALILLPSLLPHALLLSLNWVPGKPRVVAWWKMWTNEGRQREWKKENAVWFITSICIMGLIGPLCIFSGGGWVKRIGGCGRGYRSRQRETAADQTSPNCKGTPAWLASDGISCAAPSACGFDNMVSGGWRQRAPLWGADLPPLTPSVLWHLDEITHLIYFPWKPLSPMRWRSDGQESGRQ